MLLAVLAALLAAALFAVATALQHLSAGKVDEAGKSHRTGFRRFASQTLRHPLWVVGVLANVAGLVLHAVALREGPLTLVQPLLVSGVIFALPLRRALERHSPRREELSWAVVLAAGLAGFIVLASPGQGASQAPDLLATLVFAAVLGVGILLGCLGGWYYSGTRAAALLGATAALAFGACAGLLKQVVGETSHGLIGVFGTWPLYALALVGVFGLVVNQLAYQAGPLRASLPMLTTVDPIVGLLIGVVVFDEPFRTGTPFAVGEALALALVVVAAVALTRGEAPAPAPALPLVEERPAVDLSSSGASLEEVAGP